MKIEKIEWMDSGMYIDTDGWEPIKHVLKKWRPSHMKVSSSGIVAYEDDDVVGLSLTYSESTDALIGLQMIWKPSILKREVLDDDMDQHLPDRGPDAIGVLRDQQEGE